MVRLVGELSLKQLADTNSNKSLILTPTASAVNELTLINAATGNGVELGTSGTDTDVDLLLTAKGAGVVKADGVEVVTLSGSQTLTSKTLTSPVLNTGVSGTAFLDDDTFATATATTLASSQSIKAYVDSTAAGVNELSELIDTTIAIPSAGQVIIWDGIDSWDNKSISGDASLASTGALTVSSIGGDAVTLGGAFTTSGAFALTLTQTGATNVTLPTTGTLATLAGTETLTNKTLTSPVLNTSISGTAFLDDDTFATATATTLASSESIKAYVDSVASGLDVKDSVRMATSGSIANLSDVTVANPDGQTQGVTLVEGDRILVKDTASADGIEALAAKRNGIYVVGTVTTGTAPLTRASDADTDAEVTAGMFTFVAEGDHADSGFVLTTNDPITLDTTSLVFSQFSDAGQVTAGDGLTKTGNTIDVVGGDGITANINDIQVDSTVLRTNATQSITTGTTTFATGSILDVDSGATLDINLGATFKVQGVATGITGTELETLSSGSTSDASSLHSHTSSQSFTSQTSVVVTHSLGRFPIVQVLDATDKFILPDEITHNSVNQFTVTFATAETGNILYN